MKLRPAEQSSPHAPREDQPAQLCEPTLAGKSFLAVRLKRLSVLTLLGVAIGLQSTATATPTESLHELCRRLQHPRGVAERLHAAETIAEYGRRAVPPLCELLRHSDPKVREFAGLALVRIGPAAEQAVPQLTALLQVPQEPTRATAMLARAAAQQNSTPTADRQGNPGLGGPGRGRAGKGRVARSPAETRGQRREGDGGEFRTEVPKHAFDLILARPTHSSIMLSVGAYEDIEGYVAYGTEQGRHAKTTPPQALKAGQTVEILIGSLQPNTRYYYEFCSRRPAEAPFEASAEYTFHTARPPGSEFTFTVTADSHLDEQTDPAVYRQTLTNTLADAPDFHIDLGDTFMTEKHASRESAARQYVAQRYYFGLVAHSSPLYLVLGNHDGESGQYRDGTADNLAVWSNAMRKKYFPNPVPDGFYAGNAAPDRFAGQLQDYYAWEWGNALFVVLDPFWFAPRLRGGGDNWTRTLGAEQYQWLRRTLQQSRARFKFVFIHHLVGGLDKQSRGGAEAAPFYEWGGKNADGSERFQQHRPDWPAPIHQLLVETGVSIAFHGHDHLFAKQELDGLVYQEVPQPGLRRYNTPRTAAEYGYVQGHILGGPGHLRIAVSPDRVAVAFVSSCLPEDETADRRNREVRCHYSLP